MYWINPYRWINRLFHCAIYGMLWEGRSVNPSIALIMMDLSRLVTG